MDRAASRGARAPALRRYSRRRAPFLEAALETLVTIAWGEPTADLSQLHAWIAAPGERRAVFAQLLAAQVLQSVRLGAFELLSPFSATRPRSACSLPRAPDDNATRPTAGQAPHRRSRSPCLHAGWRRRRVGGARLNSGRDVPAAPWRPPTSCAARHVACQRALGRRRGRRPRAPRSRAPRSSRSTRARPSGSSPPRLDLKLTERLVWTLQAHVHSLPPAGWRCWAADRSSATVRGRVLL